MPLQATSGAASYDAFGGGVVAEPNYIESCFSTWLYTGNDTSQTITNGIDLAGKGGLVWSKQRTGTQVHVLVDTVRGNNKRLQSNSTAAEDTTSSLMSFNSDGYGIPNSYGILNSSGQNYASWTFRKQPKFFDVVTYTGNGVAGRTIAHNLGAVPGCIIVKSSSMGGVNWDVYHRSLGATGVIFLNTTDAAGGGTGFWNDTAPTSSVFTVGSRFSNNASGETYVAYLFAHNAGGFGLSGTDNVISCGSFSTGAYLSVTTVNLGYEPQWLLVKSTADENWWLVDNMRGMPVGSADATLNPNLSAAESLDYDIVSPTATGFTTVAGSSLSTSATYIYIAIRRGPMRTPTTGTSVFSAVVRTGTGANVTVNGAGFAPDLVATANRDANGFGYYDKLRGALRALRPSQTSAEATYTTTLTGFTNTGYTAGSNSDGFGEINGNTDPYVNHMFRRAPGFFDEVCWTANVTDPTAMTVNHNLGVVPQMIIKKARQTNLVTNRWRVYHAGLNGGVTPQNYVINLNLDSAESNSTSDWNSTAPTATQFTAGYVESGVTYVAYLFASCPGVSKVGSYTGTGTTQTINCGFTAGSRFVLIKRTDSTGDWYVWDSARGIVAGNDPYLLLNSTAAEVTNTDFIDTASTGFEISSTAPAAINASGGTYIFLAIA